MKFGKIKGVVQVLSYFQLHAVYITCKPVATASTLCQSQVRFSEMMPTFTSKAINTACLPKVGKSLQNLNLCIVYFVLSPPALPPHAKPNYMEIFQVTTIIGTTILPERNKHHHFDTEEFSHRSDGTQLIFQSSVEQHQAVHGKLEQIIITKHQVISLHIFFYYILNSLYIIKK